MLHDTTLHVNVQSSRVVSRRRFLQIGGTGMAGAGFLQQIGLNAAELKKQNRACILVWLAGGPSQMELWDPKPGTKNGGDAQAISTAVPGVQIAEYWPKLATHLKDLAVIRSMTNKEAAHGRATYHLHTGRRPTGNLKFPSFGAVVAQELGDPEAEIPNFVSVGQTVSSGFLGVHVAPFIVDSPGQLPRNVAMKIGRPRLNRRLALLQEQDADFANAGAKLLTAEHQSLYKQASKMMLSAKLKAFQLDDESAGIRDAYGSSQFGQGLLVARRLVESGVPFVEVRRGGWDNHRDLYKVLPKNAADVDNGVSQLLADLKQRGLLERTLVVCMGEFGRTPKLNPRGGRDHWARNFTLWLAGAGVKGGQVIGKTSSDGMEISADPVIVEDLFQSMCRGMQMESSVELMTPIGRPLKIVDGGSVIPGLFG